MDKPESADDGVSIPLLRKALASPVPGKPTDTLENGQAPASVAAPAQPRIANPQASPSSTPVRPPIPISNEVVFSEPPPEFLGLTNTPAAPAAPTAPVATAEPPEPAEIRKDPRAKSAWEYQKKENKTLRDQLAEADKARKELAAQVEQAKAQKSEREAELEKSVQRLEAELGRYSLEATSEFRNKHDTPIEMLKGKARTALMRAGKSAEEASQLVEFMVSETTSDDDMQTSLSEINNQYVSGVIASAVFDARERQQARKRDLENWQQAKAALESESTKTNEHLRKTTLIKDTTDAVHTLADKHGSWVFKANPDSPEWEKQRERLVLEAQHILTEGSDQDLSRAVVESTASRYYRTWGESLMKQNEELRRALESRDASRPRIGIGGSIAPREPPAQEESVRSPIALEEGLRLAGIGR
jgi:hypothetical protein